MISKNTLLFVFIALSFYSCKGENGSVKPDSENKTTLNPEKDAAKICGCLKETIEYPAKASDCEKLINDVVRQYKVGSAEEKAFRKFMRACKM